VSGAQPDAELTLFGIGFSMKVVLIAFAAMWPTLRTRPQT
jgi:hypothetical protein